ncbi:hypothetical protein J2Y69_003323 [Microbacterium resistens]|uniref:Uncharacterized protein n=1 Tax=Microbacterium resistens TaxID=156977 RepID=A0ABU1SGM9_9MICO|nr:hypothetical protein [Microbacterium resistens]MDR6868699.1 hypothetical protein [Microbacterium resistens]
MTHANSPDDALPVHAAIARAVADYRRIFPAPLPLAPNLTLAVRALAERDALAAKLAAVEKLAEGWDSRRALFRAQGAYEAAGFLTRVITQLRDIITPTERTPA